MRTRYKTFLFLTELILVVMFFALSAAVCIKIFVQAKTISNYASYISSAVLEARSAAEAFKSADADLLKTSEILCASEKNGALYLYYDDDFLKINENDKIKFTLTLSPMAQKGDRNCAEITIKDDSGKMLFSIRAKAVTYEQ